MKMKISVGIASSFLLTGALFIWFGVFNVSATEKHWTITNTLLQWVRTRSIEVRSRNIDVPSLDDLEMISRGAKNYDAMCVQCHLAPGIEPTEISSGLYPQPPVFHNSEHPPHDTAATYWTIKHGLKMTGMPAWGAFHTEQQLWQLVAFIDELNGMSANRYEELVGEGGHSHGDESMNMRIEETDSSNKTPSAHNEDGHGH